MARKFFNSNEGEVIEFTVRDWAGNKIETRRCLVKDEALLEKTFALLKEKYGNGVRVEAKSSRRDWLSPDSEFLKF